MEDLFGNEECLEFDKIVRHLWVGCNINYLSVYITLNNFTHHVL
jgi:hypothetical protein